MPPSFLHTLALVYVPLSIACALYVVADITVAGRAQPMPIMSVVWPLTMLYWGPIGLIFYFWFGRARPERDSGGGSPEPPMWHSTFSGAAHCGAGCALGDFAGEWIAFGLGLTLAGSPLAAKLCLSFVLAYVLGILFQYFSIAPMRGLGVREGLAAAVKADSLSLAAYEVGMFASMSVTDHLFPALQPTQLSYWLLMQLAMVIGFLTTWPVNVWLIAREIKPAM